MNHRFTQHAQNVLNNSLLLASSMGHTYIGSEHLLLALAKERESFSCCFLESHGLFDGKIHNAITEFAGTGMPSKISPKDMTPRTKRMIEGSARFAARFFSSTIGTEHLLGALFEERESVAVRLLTSLGVNIGDLENELCSFLASEKDKTPSLQKSGKYVSPFSQGSPLALYGKDLTLSAYEGKTDPLIGRERELERVIQILSRRTKNNPCLIGEPGVGKSAIAEGLARQIVSGEVPEGLLGKSLILLDISAMIAGAKYRGEFEDRMKSIIKEASENKRIILFIDEIHIIVGAGAAEGAVDAANILKPALARGELQVLGATTIKEYRARIEKDAALERRFQSVLIPEPDEEEAIRILKGLREKYEAHHKLSITDDAIEAAVKLSVRYLSDRFLPDKAIDLLDEAASSLCVLQSTASPALVQTEKRMAQLSEEKLNAIKAQNFEEAARLRDEEAKIKSVYEAQKEALKQEAEARGGVLLSSHIAKVVTQRTGIPISTLNETEEEKLSRLEEALSHRIIGQEEAVKTVAKAIRRTRLGLKNPRRPIGSFLFLGPTGVGKTELSKTLASVLFGKEDAFIRLDMSEYMEKHSVSKLLGSPPGYVGYEEGGQLTEKVRRRPYSVVLFDEIEKAHPDIFNILLQITEDGILTDSQGRHVDFANTVIILTSNVGARENEESKSLGFVTNKEEKGEAIAKDVLKRTFRPEFLNRLDEIVYFKKLNKEDLEKIASLLIEELRERARESGLTLIFEEGIAAFLAQKDIDPAYGARPLRRTLRRYIEDALSSALLSGELDRSLPIIIKSENGSIRFLQTANTLTDG